MKNNKLQIDIECFFRTEVQKSLDDVHVSESKRKHCSTLLFWQRDFTVFHFL